MKNIHILPTDKPSRLIKSQDDDFIFLNTDAPNWFQNNLKTTKQNIYITSDEEIKEGDWFLDDNNQISHSYRLSHVKFANPKKIILTTDQNLIDDGVQAIGGEFLEWFVKNPSCEWIEVNKIIWNIVNDFEYKIIIPKEEPKQEALEEVGMYQQELFNYLQDLRVTALQSEMQEIERIVLSMQQERMYSYEEVLEQLNLLYSMKNSLVDTFTDENDYITMKWFEQFKKK